MSKFLGVGVQLIKIIYMGQWIINPQVSSVYWSESALNAYILSFFIMFKTDVMAVGMHDAR